MIKFTAAGTNITLIGLGLEPENIRRMQLGSPVRVRLADLGFTGAIGLIQLVIFTGESREAIEAAMQPFISPETVIHR